MPAGPTSDRRVRRGFTLVEVLIATTLASILTLACLTSFLYTIRGERSLANYGEMNQKARVLLEQMGRDFRSAGDVPAGGYSTTSVTLKVPTDTTGTAWQTVVWAYDAAHSQITRTDATGTAKVYASNVASCSFSYYNTSGNTPSNDVEVKQIQLSMRMLRSVESAQTSEYVISAQFTLRAKSTTV
jgi:prepilin-type N-terminal cleavage/methylation domain-containing protein